MRRTSIAGLGHQERHRRSVAPTGAAWLSTPSSTAPPSLSPVTRRRSSDAASVATFGDLLDLLQRLLDMHELKLVLLLVQMWMSLPVTATELGRREDFAGSLDAPCSTEAAQELMTWLEGSSGSPPHEGGTGPAPPPVQATDEAAEGPPAVAAADRAEGKASGWHPGSLACAWGPTSSASWQSGRRGQSSSGDFATAVAWRVTGSSSGSKAATGSLSGVGSAAQVTDRHSATGIQDLDDDGDPEDPAGPSDASVLPVPPSALPPKDLRVRPPSQVSAPKLPGQVVRGTGCSERGDSKGHTGPSTFGETIPLARVLPSQGPTPDLTTKQRPSASILPKAVSGKLRKVASACCPRWASKVSGERSSVSKLVRASTQEIAAAMRRRGATRPSVLQEIINADMAGEMWYAAPDHWFILHPNSRLRIVWDLMALVMVLIDGLTLPFSIGFGQELPAALSWTSVAFFTLDMLLNFVTGFYQDGCLVMKQYIILRNYFKSWFLVDLTSTFPWSVIADDGASATLLRFTKIGKFLRIMKLLRFAKMNVILQTFEDFFYSPTLVISLKLAKIIGMISLVVHWTACVWGWLGDPDRYDSPFTTTPYQPADCDKGGPCEPGMDGSPWRRRFGVETESVASQYLFALRWATGLFTGSDIGVQPGYWAERVFTVLVSFGSFILLSTIISKVVIMFEKINQEHADQDEVMMQFKEFMASSKVPIELQAKVRRYLEYQYKARRELQVRRFEMLDRLSPWLRKELTVHLNRAVLNLHPLFRGMPIEVQPHICCSAQCLLCAPGDIVMQMGQNSTFMYFIVRGKVQMTALLCPTVEGEEAQMVSHSLTAPGYVGADCLFGEQVLKYTVKCVSHCELLKITMEELAHLEQEFPALKAYMNAVENRKGDRSDPHWDCSAIYDDHVPD